MTKSQGFRAWGKILAGRAPMLSIEITRECPLECPGCYAYADGHLGGKGNLRNLSDLRGDALVSGVVGLVKSHGALQVSLVGGEPLIRHRELSSILPQLSAMGVYTLIVTSAVIPIPQEWNRIPKVRIAVSVDGLRTDHDKRRAPATYDKILENIRGRRVDLSWVITRPMMQSAGYLEEYLSFWTCQPEIDRIWLNVYTPQIGETSKEKLNADDRRELVRQLMRLKGKHPQLLMTDGIARAFETPPSHPGECTFAKMSVNYSADLKTRVEPCFYGGRPDCSQCGCAVTAGLHWVGNKRLLGLFRADRLIKGSIALGSLINRLSSRSPDGLRWQPLDSAPRDDNKLVQIRP